MFRDDERWYFISGVVLVLALTGLSVWYEVHYRKDDSWPEAIASIGQGIASAVAATITLLATLEVLGYMVLLVPNRIRVLKAQGAREADARWEAWLKRRDEAQAKGEEFNEPTPSGQNQTRK